MTTGKALSGKPHAGNPHVRFDEGEVASAAMPRRGSLFYNSLDFISFVKKALFAVAAIASGVALAANPILPLWEYIPDGEPYVFDDPDNPGKMRVYLYGSHDTLRNSYCGYDYTLWSAPLEEPSRWRCHGVIFRSVNDANGAPLHKSGRGDVLWDPDAQVVTGKDGRKTYYLFPFNVRARERLGMVAKSSRPDGPFKVCNWSKTDPKKVDSFGFHLATFVDDDGKAYVYWGRDVGFGSDSVSAAELDTSTMCTLKPGAEIRRNVITSWRQEGVDRYFEGPSMRKIKDKYVLIYARHTAEGEFGLGAEYCTLAYAYSDSPLGPFTYGGTLIDLRGREKAPDGKTRITAAPGGNTHGSLCEVNGQWYVFYHRQTGLNEFSRQAMVGRVDVTVDERPGGKVSISEAEIDSMGFETDGLDPFELHAAGIASHYTGPAPARRKPRYSYSGPYPAPFRCDGYAARDPYGPDVNRCALVNCTDGSVAGWKYFNFNKTFGKKGLTLSVELETNGLQGVIDVWVKRPSAKEGGIKVGSFTLAPNLPAGMHRVEIPVEALAAVKGREALYLTFSSPVKKQSICTLHTLQFRLDRPR